MKRILKLIIFCALLMGNTLPVSAAEGDAVVQDVTIQKIPFSRSYYYHFSKDQQLSALVKDFCSMQGISVIVSPVVTDIVNGRFNKMDPSDFWDYITQAYGLSWFYDGKILYVYKNSELQTQVFKMDAAGINTMSNIIDHLGFTSSDFSFRSVPSANILIVTAPPKYLETVNDLSAKFVAEKIADTTIVKTFPLKYAWAYDMNFTYKDGSMTVPGVATLLQNIVSGNQTSYSMSGMDVDLGGHNQSKHDKHKSSISQNNSSSNKKNNNSNDSSSKEGKQSSDDNESFPTTHSLPGLIACDQRLNAVIIRDRYENMPFYEDIINQLDVPCEVIKIDVAIVDINRTSGSDIGPDSYGMKNHKNSLGFGISGTDQGIAGTLATAGANVAGQMTGILKGYSISSYLQALESNGNAKTVAKPSVLTLDNVGAIIGKDHTMYTQVIGKNTSDLYDIDVTTKLQVVPHIIPNDVDANGRKKMKMFVNVQDGSVSGDTKAGATPACDNSSINTQAVLYEGQSLLIGGYFKEYQKNSASGIPFIQNLPLIGRAFRRTVKATEMVERIYVISPTVVDIDAQDHKFDHFMRGGDLETHGQFGPIPSQSKKKYHWKKH